MTTRWFHCDVVRVGPGEDGRIFIRLKDKGQQFSRWFIAVPSQSKEMLAIALAAASSGFPVDAVLEDPPTEYSPIYAMYLASSAEW